MTIFTADSRDFLGETVHVARHRFDGERTVTTCYAACGHVRDIDGEPCGELVVADGPAALSSVYPEKNYTGRHPGGGGVMDTFLVIYTDIDGTTYPVDDLVMDRETALGVFGDLVNPALPVGARVAVMSEHEWRSVRPLGGGS